MGQTSEIKLSTDHSTKLSTDPRKV